MALMSPTKFSRTSLVEFDENTPRRPYLTFQVGPGNIDRLVVKIWSNDQGFTSSSRNQTDPFGGSHTWFAFGLVQELDGIEDAPLEDLVGFQRNLCASKIIQNHVNEWTFGLPIEDDDDAEVQCWLESLTQVENVKIGIFPLARYQAWVNTVWKIEVDVYHGDQIESALASEEISHPVALHDTTLYHRRTQTRSCATQILRNEDVSVLMESAIDALQENSANHSHSGSFWRSLGARVQETRSPQVLDALIRALSLEVDPAPRAHHHSQQSAHGADMNHQNLDLASAIEALQLQSQGSSQIQPANLDVDRTSKVDLLASSLLKKFMHTQSLRDINQAIDLWTTEINRNHIPGPLAARRLEYLGECFSERARVFDSEEDLKRAVQLTDEAINGMPLAHPNYPDLMMSLANRLNLLSSRSRSMNDLNRAVHAAEVAAVLTLEDHPLRPVRLEVHGAMLCERSERTGSIEDLRCAIGVLDMGLQASPDGHPVALGLLGGMGRCLGNMYDYTGFLGDLDKSIECLSAAVAGMSRDHPHITIYLNLLGTQLSKRHEHTGSMDDIDHSIKTLQKTLDMIPEHNPLRLTLMTNISASLLLRYGRTGAVDDLQNAIDITDSALRATPPGHEAYAARSANLGAFLSRRYEKFRSIDDLNRANELLRTAVALLLEDDPRRPLEMNNLTSGLFIRFLETQSNDDLDEAIDVLKIATTIIPENHPERAMVFENLVRCYYRRGQHTVDDQMRCSLEGWNSRNSPPSIRIAMAYLAAGLLNRNERFEESSQILEDAVSLLPSVSPRALKGSDQQHMLQKVPGLASLAASTALHSGKSPVDAIRLLESGRGIMAGLLSETRTEIEGLKQSCHQLADEFSSLRDKLDSPSSIANPQLTEQDTSSWETQAKQRRELESRFNEVVAEIRTKAGFEDFLLPPKAETLLSAASSGPIVVLNATFWRCDAIIINSSGIQLLPLPRFGLLNIEGGIQFSTYSLESMWDVIARPILDHLGFIESPKDGNFPHVWWILTGSLSRLPIHAAGYHYEGSSETVIDRVVSSYSTSIKALLQSRQNSVRNLRRGTSHKACLISMRTTPSQGSLEPSDLEFAEQEIQTLDSLLSPAVPTTLLSQPDKDDVLLHLESCTAFHFAGHGITNSLDPSKSSLLLKDWVNSPLTVEDLTALNLFEKSPWLAYLSACSTGDNQAERLQDESVHLVSACQLAGFPHVVGSLWKIDDECSAEAAAEVYRTIVEHGWTDESVALGVHNAARLLRKKTTGEMWARRVKLHDSRNLDVLSHGNMDTNQERARGFDEYAVRSEGDPSIWAAYIHVGP